MKEKLAQMLGHDIGIDLGTANTLVYARGHGIVINEPSVVAINQKTGRVVAVGNQARDMLGRTPQHIQAIRPLVDGVISDFEVTEEMLIYLLGKTQTLGWKPLGPRVVVGVPSGITNVQIRAVRDAARSAGAREVFIIEEAMGAAIGMRLPVKDAVGSMVVDIGGGTTDIAVISLGGVVNAKNLRIAGDKLNQAVSTYIRDTFQVLVGEKTAEETKIAIGTARQGGKRQELSVRGRDVVTGLPREVVITESDVSEAMNPLLSKIIESTKEVLETTPPEILSDIMHRGLVLAGGGALIDGLAERMEEELQIPVHVTTDPLLAVVRGTGIVVEDLEGYKEVLVEHDDALPPES